MNEGEYMQKANIRNGTKVTIQNLKGILKIYNGKIGYVVAVEGGTYQVVVEVRKVLSIATNEMQEVIE